MLHLRYWNLRKFDTEELEHGFLEKPQTEISTRGADIEMRARCPYTALR